MSQLQLQPPLKTKYVLPKHFLVPKRFYAALASTMSCFEIASVIGAAVNLYDKPGPITAVKLATTTHLSVEMCLRALEWAVVNGSLVQELYHDPSQTRFATIYRVNEWTCISVERKSVGSPVHKYNKLYEAAETVQDLTRFAKQVYKSNHMWSFQTELLYNKRARDIMRRTSKRIDGL